MIMIECKLGNNFKRAQVTLGRATLPMTLCVNMNLHNKDSFILKY